MATSVQRSRAGAMTRMFNLCGLNDHHRIQQPMYSRALGGKDAKGMNTSCPEPQRTAILYCVAKKPQWPGYGVSLNFWVL